jgi:steroid delta-isomerase-like uncharacterized protein
MSQANKDLVYRWFEQVWNQGRESAIDELFAASGIAHGIGQGEATLHGPAEFKPFVRNLRGSLPDVRISVQDAISEGDKVTVRVLLEGTHSGPGLGVSPTGRKVRVAGIVLVRIANGQIVEGWNSWDQLGLLRQIGALPSLEGHDRLVADSGR